MGLRLKIKTVYELFSLERVCEHSKVSSNYSVLLDMVIYTPESLFATHVLLLII